MKLTGADIYTHHIFTDKMTNFKSLKQACQHIYNLSRKEQEETLLCIGNRNLDYIKQEETLEDYYNRMKKIVQKI